MQKCRHRQICLVCTRIDPVAINALDTAVGKSANALSTNGATSPMSTNNTAVWIKRIIAGGILSFAPVVAGMGVAPSFAQGDQPSNVRSTLAGDAAPAPAPHNGQPRTAPTPDKTRFDKKAPAPETGHNHNQPASNAGREVAPAPKSGADAAPAPKNVRGAVTSGNVR